MRKIAAILLLVILLFNWVGYRLFSDFLQHHSNIQLEAKLDKNEYKEDQLLEIKVPLHLPYQQNWSEFERFDGEIDVDGIHYKYVKRKIQNDSLVLLCLPNEGKQTIEKAKDDYFKNVNDIATNSQKKSENSNTGFKNILSEFFVEQPFRLNIHSECFTTKHYMKETFFLSSNFKKLPTQPPDC